MRDKISNFPPTFGNDTPVVQPIGPLEIELYDPETGEDITASTTLVSIRFAGSAKTLQPYYGQRVEYLIDGMPIEAGLFQDAADIAAGVGVNIAALSGLLSARLDTPTQQPIFADGVFITSSVTPTVLDWAGLSSNATYSDYAEVGSEDSITIDANGKTITSFSWGEDGEFGTGPNPTDFAAIDNGSPANPALLTVTVVVEGLAYDLSVPVRAVAPTKNSDLTISAMTVGQAITPIDVTSVVTGTGLSASLNTGSIPAGLSFANKLITGAPLEESTNAVTFSVYNSGGTVSVAGTFDITAAAQTLKVNTPQTIAFTTADVDNVVSKDISVYFYDGTTPYTYEIILDETSVITLSAGAITATGKNVSGEVHIRATDDNGAEAVLVCNVNVDAQDVVFLDTFPTVYAVGSNPISTVDAAPHFTPSGLSFSLPSPIPSFAISTVGIVSGFYDNSIAAPVFTTDWTAQESGEFAGYLTASVDVGYTVPEGHELVVYPTQEQTADLPVSGGVLISSGGTWISNDEYIDGSSWYVKIFLRRTSDNVVIGSSISTLITIADGGASVGTLSIDPLKNDDVYDCNFGRRGKEDAFVFAMRPLCGNKATSHSRSYGSGWTDDGQYARFESGPPGLNTVVTGKDFTNRQVVIKGSGNVAFRDCKFGPTAAHGGVYDSGLRMYCKVDHGVGTVDIQYCDFKGINHFVGENSCFNRSASANDVTATVSGATILRFNLFSGMAQDGMTLTGHPGNLIEYNWIEYGAVTADAGDSPHSDAIVVSRGKGGYIRCNWIDMRPIEGQPESTGSNNCLRAMPNTNSTVPFGGFTFEGNVCLKARSQNGKPMQISKNDTLTYEPIIIVGNRITGVGTDGSTYIHNNSGNTDFIWMHNIDHWSNREVDAAEINTILTSGQAIETNDPVYEYNYARVYLGGRSNGVAIIEARAVSQGDGGAKTTSWQVIDTSTPDGDWSGILKVPGSAAAFKAEAREASAPSTTVVTAQTFRVGVGIDMWSQSNGSAAFYPQSLFGSTRWDSETVENSYCMWASFADRSTFVTTPHPDSAFEYHRVRNGAPIVASWKRLANRWNDAMGGMPLKWTAFAISGSSIIDDVKDDGVRLWLDELKLAQVRGARPGIGFQFLEGGTNATMCHPNVYGTAWFGVDENGDPFSPGFYESDSSGKTLDNSKEQIYGDASDRFIHTVMKPYSGSNHASSRRYLERAQGHPIYDKYFAPLTFPTQGSVGVVLKGENNGANDTSHAAQDTQFGFVAQAEQLLGFTILRTGSLGNKIVPAINYVRVSPNGDGKYVAVGWTEGLLTTFFRREGLTRLTGGKYTRADVTYFDGYYAEIRDPDTGALADQGEIWISKKDQTNWTAAQRRAIPVPPNARRPRDGAGSTDLSNGWTTAHHPCAALRGIHEPIEFAPDPGVAPVPADLFTNYEAYEFLWQTVRKS